MVERLPEEQEVEGSIPSLGTSQKMKVTDNGISSSKTWNYLTQADNVLLRMRLDA